MKRNGIALAFGFAAASLVAAAGVPALGAGAEDKNEKTTKEQIKELMVKTHRGEKSPFARAKEELKKDSPEWDQLAKDAKAIGEMAELLKKGSGGYTDPKGYISASEAFGKAAGEKDVKATAEAFTKLSKSCGACHYGVPK